MTEPQEAVARYVREGAGQLSRQSADAYREELITIASDKTRVVRAIAKSFIEALILALSQADYSSGALEISLEHFPEEHAKRLQFRAFQTIVRDMTKTIALHGALAARAASKGTYSP